MTRLKILSVPKCASKNELKKELEKKGSYAIDDDIVCYLVDKIGNFFDEKPIPECIVSCALLINGMVEQSDHAISIEDAIEMIRKVNEERLKKYH